MSVNYHAWTHRPKEQGGTDPLDFQFKVFRAIISEPLGDTVGTAEVALDWDLWDQNFDTAIYDPVASTGGIPVQGTDVVRKVVLKLPGRYSFQVDVDVYSGSGAGQPDGTVTVAYYDNTGAQFGEYKPVHHAPDTGTDLVGQLASHWSYTYPLYDPFDMSGPPPPTVIAQWLITTESSSPLTVTSAALEIHYFPALLPPPSS